jgi:DNA-binding NarL/FixJ family response regulator
MSPDRQPHAPRGRSASELLIVDDHPAIGASIRTLPTQHIDPRVIAETGSAGAPVTAVQSPPNVAVVEYQLGGRNRLWLGR